MLIAATGFSQKKIFTKETSGKMSKGYNTGITVNIPGATKKDVERLWKRKVKNYRGKVSSSKGDIFADDATIKSVSDNSMDIYANIKETSDGVQMTVFFDLGDAYMSSSKHASKFKSAEGIVYKFAVSAAKEAVGLELTAAGKALKKMENEQNKLESENEKLNKEIDRCQETIKNNEATLIENEKKQEAKKAEIEQQKGAVNQVQEKMNNIR